MEQSPWSARPPARTRRGERRTHGKRGQEHGNELYEAGEYKSARAMDLLATKTRGMDAYLNEHKLDAVLFAGSAGAAIAAKAGSPSVMTPGGFVSGSDGKDTPD
jgi:hypothetical protein